MKNLSLFFILFATTGASAATVRDFSEVWKNIRAKHPELAASRSEKEAAEAASARADRHWLPRVSLWGRGFSTNDAGTNLFANLGQRSVTAADFSPDVMNRPGSHTFGQASLSGEWLLYEGGRSVNVASLSQYDSDAKALAESAAVSQAYVDTVSRYATVINSDQTLQSLSGIQKHLEKILGSYSLGSKSNPVGYSGLLGLKGTLQRTEASRNEIKLEEDASREELDTRAANADRDWDPVSKSVGQFLKEKFPNEKLNGEGSSYFSEMADLGARMSSAQAQAEKARFLPQVGLFADGSYWTGSRSNATSYAGGIFLRWSVFDPRDFGIAGESASRADAAEFKKAGAHLNESINRKNLAMTIATLEKNEGILNESDRLLDEQLQSSLRLFQSGSINVLQLVEVFQRRVDLVLQKHQLNREQIQKRGQLVMLSRWNGDLP